MEKTSVKNLKLKKEFISLKIRDLVKPAYGCTEIGVIAFCVAAASQFVEDIMKIKYINVEISSYIFKNVRRVGVPSGLGKCGVKGIIAAGAIIADPTSKLEIIKDIKHAQKKNANVLVANNKIVFHVLNDCDPVYVHTTIVDNKNNIYESLVKKYHTSLVYVKKNGKKMNIDSLKESNEQETRNVTSKKNSKIINFTHDDITIDDILNISKTFSKSELAFLKENFEMNEELARYGLKNPVKNSFTYYFVKTLNSKPSIYDLIIRNTCSAIDARMIGATLPVMSASGSGDHGLTASIPQFTFHKCKKTDEKLFLQALLVVNLIIWKIKANIGELSFICGSVFAAATATIAGIAFQEKMSNQKIKDLLESLLCSYNLCFCDGAKLSCTHKIASALMSGFGMYDLAKLGYKVEKNDGIVTGDIEKTIKIFAKISDDNSSSNNNTMVKEMAKND